MKILHKKTPLKCTQPCFQDGQFKLINENAKINDHLFAKYQYVMPSFLFSYVDIIRNYFKQLDLTSKEHKIRVTPDELFDTSINVLYSLRAGLNIREQFVLGSQHISPVTWAIIGNRWSDDESTLVQNKFDNFYDLVRYYELKIVHHKNYATMNVFQRKDNFTSGNKLQILSEICDVSKNVILTVSIMFLLDLIKHSGPDSTHFLEIYTNNNRGTFNGDVIENWQKAYKSTVSSTNYYYPSNSRGKSKTKGLYAYDPKNNYSEIEIIDISTNFYDL